MESLIVALVALGIIALAAIYVVKAKKRGTRCIGCPSGGKCGSADCPSGCPGSRQG